MIGFFLCVPPCVLRLPVRERAQIGSNAVSIFFNCGGRRGSQGKTKKLLSASMVLG